MPVFNRMVVILGSMVFIAVNLTLLLTSAPRPGQRQAPVGIGIMLFAASIMLGVGIFGYRRKETEGIPGSGPSERPEGVESSPGMVASNEVGITGRSKRVIVDPDLRRIRFVSCHVPRKFLAKADPEFRCDLDEILAFSEVRTQNGPYLLIVTTRGKATVGGGAGGYRDLKAYFESLDLPTLGGPEVETPQMSGLVICGVMAGIMLGWWSVPAQEPEVAFVVRLVAGACLGALVPMALVVAAERWLHLRLVYPLLGGFIGAVAIASLALLAVSLFPRGALDDLFGKANWYVNFAVPAAILGALAGLFVGSRINRAKTRRRAGKPGPLVDADWS